VDELAIKMYESVQGCINASHKWGEHVEEVILHKLLVFSQIVWIPLLFWVKLLMISYAHVNIKLLTKLSSLFLKPNELFMPLVLLAYSLAFILFPPRIASPLIRQKNRNYHYSSFWSLMEISTTILLLIYS
jgi:hypothetical protein